METLPGGANSEQISEEFYCCICLDLLFKPVVLVCGHLSCFWCVHQSMNEVQESQCPICRNPYHYFPTICEVLHFLLVKAYPETYKRRESQILVEEEAKGCFSPSFCSSQHKSLIGEHLNDKDDNKNTPNRTFGSVGGGINAVDMKEINLSETNHISTYQKISVNDVLCAACNQLLIQPAVLNCGHVFCTSCIEPADEAVGAVCQVCQRIDPRGFPKVCLAFDNFLVEHFPKEYATRKHAAQLKQAHMQHENPVTCSTTADENGIQLSSPRKENLQPCWGNKGAHFHTGVGCDFCGMFPIVGDRYKCVDCKEDIGFDLCGQCYNSHSKVPGRFNQQHTPEHKFELLNSNHFRIFLSRMLRGQTQDRLFPFLFSSVTAASTTDAQDETNIQLSGSGGGGGSVRSRQQDETTTNLSSSSSSSIPHSTTAEDSENNDGWNNTT